MTVNSTFSLSSVVWRRLKEERMKKILNRHLSLSLRQRHVSHSLQSSCLHWPTEALSVETLANVLMANGRHVKAVTQNHRPSFMDEPTKIPCQTMTNVNRGNDNSPM